MTGKEGTPPRWKAWPDRPCLLSDWDARFEAWLEASWSLRPRFGTHDCLLDVAAAIEAQTGRDFAEGHRGAYQGAQGAADHLTALGFDGAEALLDTILDPVAPAFAQRGDIALACMDGLDPVPGVVIGGEALFVVHGHRARLRLPRPLWVKAWAVGREV